MVEEISNFLSHYFGSHVNIKVRDLGRNVKANVDEEFNPNFPYIFSEKVRYATSKGTFKYLDDQYHNLTHQYVIPNCELSQEHAQYELFS